MTVQWTAQGFKVAQPSKKDAGSSVQGAMSGVRGLGRAIRGRGQPGISAPADGKSSSGQSDAWALTQQLQGRTPGKPWTAYPELVGTSMNFDRLQYNFPNIPVRPNSGSRRRNVNRGGDTEEETGTKEQLALGPGQDRLALGPGSRVQDKDPMSRVRDLRPPEGRSHWLSDVGEVQYAGGEIGGARPAVGTGARLNFQAQVNQGDGQGLSGSEFGRIGEGQFPEMGRGRNVLDAASRELGPAPAASTRPIRQGGLGPKGRAQSRENISNPEQGSTPASMSRNSTPGPQRREALRKAQYAPGVSGAESARIGKVIESGDY